MPKKKKTVLKPNPNRGFATTSVPSRKSGPDLEGTVSDGSSGKPYSDVPDARAGGHDSSGNVMVAERDMDSAPTTLVAGARCDQFDDGKEQEQALQHLVDRVWDRATKESARIWKQIEFDRRLAATLPSLHWEEEFCDEVLQFALSGEPGPSVLPDLKVSSSFKGDLGSDDAPDFTANRSRESDTLHDEGTCTSRFLSLLPALSPDAPSTTTLVRCIVLYSLLLRLGFASRHIQIALEHLSPPYDLEKAVAWLFARMPREAVEAVLRRSLGRAELLDDWRQWPDEADESKPPDSEFFAFERRTIERGEDSRSTEPRGVEGLQNVELDTPTTGSAVGDITTHVSRPSDCGKEELLRTLGPEETGVHASNSRIRDDAGTSDIHTLRRHIRDALLLVDEAQSALASTLDTLDDPIGSWAQIRVLVVNCDRLVGSIGKRLAASVACIDSGTHADARDAQIRIDSIKFQLLDRMEDAERQRDFCRQTATSSYRRRIQEQKKMRRAEEEVRRKERLDIEAAARSSDSLARNHPSRSESAAVGEVRQFHPSFRREDDQHTSEIIPDESPTHGEADEEGDFFGGMLDELPDEIPDLKTGSTIVVRSLPAAALQSSGKAQLPRALLNDALRRIDVSGTMRFEALPSGGRIHRSRLTLRWCGPTRGAASNKKVRVVDTFTLTGLAAPSKSAAEELVAVVALNCIERDKPAQRYLGTGWRDWWEEIEARRKEQRDSSRRVVVAKIGDLLAGKLDQGRDPVAPRGKGKIMKQPRMDSRKGPSSEGKDDPSDLSKQDARPAGTSTRDETIQMQWKATSGAASYQRMLAVRLALPIARFRADILNTLDKSQILVLSGETGCGKSTQVPAYILEHCLSQGRPCNIYVTEPRRISAISLAHRVSSELGEPRDGVGGSESLVGYAVRLESRIGRHARLVYATTGIVLRMLEGSRLEGVTHVILDEVHERSIESDFLLIVLKALMEQRPDLKIVLMSATMDAERLSAYFGGCPTITVPGRTFPVQIHYLEDAIELCDYTIEEHSPYARRDKRYQGGRTRPQADLPSSAEDALSETDGDEVGGGCPEKNSILGEHRYKLKTSSTLDRVNEYVVNHDLIILLLERICFADHSLRKFSAATLIFVPGLADIRKLIDLLRSHREFGSHSFQVFPLHSTISSEHQGAVFEVPSPGTRKIVVATNIAETGITIPDITCVIDSGKHREMRFDEKRQLSRLVECFVSRANAKQRRGRAGRVQEGLCFHLFTRARHDHHFCDHPLPEMLRLSLQDLALKLKVMKVKLGESTEDVLSKALDPPAALNIRRAVAALVEVKALTPQEDITPLGRHLSRLPMDVHMGKFLLVACLLGALDPALTIAATLNAKSPFLSPFGQEAEAQRAKASFNVGDSDFMTYARAFAAWRRAVANDHARQFCSKAYLSQQNLRQIEDLRQQYMSYLLDSGFVQVDAVTRRDISRLRSQSTSQGRLRLMQLPTQLDVNANSLAIVNAALVSGLYPKLLAVDPRSLQLRTLSNNAPTAMHPSSVNHGMRLSALPKGCHHLLYFTIMSTRRLYAWETGVVDDRCIALVCGEAEIKLTSLSLYIDRQRMRFAFTDARTMVAFMILRERFLRKIEASFHNPQRCENDDERHFFTLIMRALGKDVPGRDLALIPTGRSLTHDQ